MGNQTSRLAFVLLYLYTLFSCIHEDCVEDFLGTVIYFVYWLKVVLNWYIVEKWTSLLAFLSCLYHFFLMFIDAYMKLWVKDFKLQYYNLEYSIKGDLIYCGNLNLIPSSFLSHHSFHEICFKVLKFSQELYKFKHSYVMYRLGMTVMWESSAPFFSDSFMFVQFCFLHICLHDFFHRIFSNEWVEFFYFLEWVMHCGKTNQQHVAYCCISLSFFSFVP